MNRREGFDLQSFLKRYSLFIYTGDPEGDLILLEDEIRELYQLGMIEKEEMFEALGAVKKQYSREER
ncbi:YqgQ family protein [Brevibacillus ruminantium]|uniref:YqgQ family protein n=1 Tax=Brevibacillus ruminantium TaxID=2950604 RepID=A0ABY4WJ03_9BACL|nr:YqgQ family protein [Brevibacillus ruminantium]USG67087.1 YqgQ family protein [Brevibacillus ruminantium]